MEERKLRILIRFQPLIYDNLEYEAAFEGVKLGGIANRLLLEELSKVEKVGINNCFVLDSEEYEKTLPEIRQGREVYILPPKETIAKYLPEKIGRTINRQVSFYLPKQKYDLLTQIVELQDIMGTMDGDRVSSYRYAVHGLLLNNPLVQKLDGADITEN